MLWAAACFLPETKGFGFNSSLRNDFFLSAHCDFEHGLTFCHWHQVNDGSDDFDWSIGKGETSSKKTGPITDHTTGTNEGELMKP